MPSQLVPGHPADADEAEVVAHAVQQLGQLQRHAQGDRGLHDLRVHRDLLRQHRQGDEAHDACAAVGVRQERVRRLEGEALARPRRDAVRVVLEGPPDQGVAAEARPQRTPDMVEALAAQVGVEDPPEPSPSVVELRHRLAIAELLDAEDGPHRAPLLLAEHPGEREEGRGNLRHHVAALADGVGHRQGRGTVRLKGGAHRLHLRQDDLATGDVARKHDSD
eukprot:CAMPEP_0176289644 /NCGR_PEP_ID=MMETSP0121_2-20121125/54605_1 /TAXON_ID=160619 /ORGANISM="Kryptoperidinium foliaceum, Strain CCMP 1326" /LENGTH=220 /DNA_ID=CAMNT_0017630393 /DNA_START=479 /DNA_END=1138 /DNA_ORIENTATION=-